MVEKIFFALGYIAIIHLVMSICYGRSILLVANGTMTKAHTKTVDRDELAGLARRYLDLADLVVAERYISWGLVRGRVDPVHVPDIFVRIHESP